jgi:hypothetical protein
MKTNIYIYIYVYIWSYFAIFFLEWEMLQTKGAEKIKTHILYSVTFFRESCRSWDNVEKHVKETDRPQMALRRMRIACWISKATSTHSEYKMFTDFPLPQWLHESAWMLCYTYIACPTLVKILVFPRFALLHRLLVFAARFAFTL